MLIEKAPNERRRPSQERAPLLIFWLRCFATNHVEGLNWVRNKLRSARTVNFPQKLIEDGRDNSARLRRHQNQVMAGRECDDRPRQLHIKVGEL